MFLLIADCEENHLLNERTMVCWNLLPLLLRFSFGLALTSFAEDISAHVHVATNDQLIAFARNRDGAFHFAFNPSEITTLIPDLSFTSVQTETVRSLSIPAQTSSFNQIDLVFIGGPRNSSERRLFHAKLQLNESDETLSVIHLWNRDIASLSSVGIECALGVHPLGTYAIVVGDRGSYIYDMQAINVQYWPLWVKLTDSFYPKAISVTMDNTVAIGVNVQKIDTVVPALYLAYLDVQNVTATPPLSDSIDMIESTSIGAPISIAMRGCLSNGRFIMVVGFPSEDAVIVYVFEEAVPVAWRYHRSEEKNINFGQAVILTNNQTYGVLSSTLGTLPWSTGRVQVGSTLRDDQ